MLLSVLYLLAFGNHICCLPWNGPQQTDSAQETRTANWSPLPTSDKKADIPFHELLNRDLYPVSVCGWIAGKPQLQALCSTRSSCVWNSDYKIVGCCATLSNECKFYTSCLDLNSPEPLGNRDDVFTCKGTSVCYSNKYPNGYSQWGCGSSEWATSVWTAFPGMGEKSLQLVTIGTGEQSTKTTIKIAISSSTSNSNLATETNMLQGAYTFTSTSSNSPTSRASGQSTAVDFITPTYVNNVNPSSKDAVPAGPIAGGVVASIALICSLLGFGFLSYRKGWFKKSQSDRQVDLIPSEDGPYPPPMEGAVNLDSDPIFELDGGRDSQVISPALKYDHLDSVGREKRSTQVSEVSQVSEVQTFTIRN